MLEEIDALDNKKSLLLHACCAPCASYPLEELEDIFETTVFFYNPNIATDEEFQKRLTELKRLIKNRNIELEENGYDHHSFLKTVKGMENLKEGGLRCHECFRMRLRETARLAKEKGYDYFSTTLTLSPLKNSQVINQLGEQIAKEEGVNFLNCDFKKRGGFLRSTELSKEYNLYRQNYCGCEFSKRKD